jgi:hypothetical protein
VTPPPAVAIQCTSVLAAHRPLLLPRTWRPRAVVVRVAAAMVAVRAAAVRVEVKRA